MHLFKSICWLLLLVSTGFANAQQGSTGQLTEEQMMESIMLTMSQMGSADEAQQLVLIQEMLGLIIGSMGELDPESQEMMSTVLAPMLGQVEMSPADFARLISEATGTDIGCVLNNETGVWSYDCLESVTGN